MANRPRIAVVGSSNIDLTFRTERLPIPEAAERVTNFLNSMTLEIQMLARACGKADVHDLEPEDLRALTLESSAITGLPLVGTHWVPGRERKA